MSSHCVVCKSLFVQEGKSFRRTSVTRELDDKITLSEFIQQNFPNVILDTSNKGRLFACIKCFGTLRSIHTSTTKLMQRIKHGNSTRNIIKSCKSSSMPIAPRRILCTTTSDGILQDREFVQIATIDDDGISSTERDWDHNYSASPSHNIRTPNQKVESRLSTIKKSNVEPVSIGKTVPNKKQKERSTLKQPKSLKQPMVDVQQAEWSHWNETIVGGETPRWNRVRESLGIEQDGTLAKLLLDMYYSVHPDMPAQDAADGEGTEQSIHDGQTQSVPVIDEDIQTGDETEHDYEHDSTSYHFSKDELDNVSQHLLDMCKVNASQGVVGVEDNHGAAVGDVREASSNPIVQPESNDQAMCNNEDIANTSHVKATSQGLKCFYQCGACDYTTPISSYLRTHVRSVHGQTKLYKCDFCDFTTASAADIKAHTATHYVTSFHRGFVCTHISSKHTGVLRYQCAQCDYATDYRYKFRNHKRKHAGLKLTHQCDICDYSTAFKPNLVRHKLNLRNHQRFSRGMTVSTRKKRCKTRNKLYKCDMCDFTTDWGTEIVVHECSAHLQEMLDNQNEMGKGDATTTDTSTTAVNDMPQDVQKREFKCDACKFSAGNQAALWAHQLSRHLELAGQKGYKCDKCGYTTAEPDLIIKHRVKHTAGEEPTCMQTCDVCNNYTGRAKKVAAHKRTVHNPVRRFKCDECSFASKYPGNVMLHKRRRHNAEEHVPLQKCSLCNYFGKPSGLAKHLCRPIEHTGGKLYTCGECGFVSQSTVGLEAHRRKHGDEKPFKCDQCSFASKYENSLTKHKRKHTGDKYKCDMCSYSSAFVCGLGQHKRFHNPDRRFKCDMCNYGFDTSSALAAHKKRKHTNLTCDECGHVAPSTRRLAEHKYKHADVKPFKCNACGFATHSSRNLRLHVKRHGRKKLQCDMCDYSTLGRRKLEIHKCRHTGEKPFKCQDCDYSAFQGPELWEHRWQAHSENYPHKCEKCRYAASTETSLMLHIKGKHPDKRYKMY